MEMTETATAEAQENEGQERQQETEQEQQQETEQVTEGYEIVNDSETLPVERFETVESSEAFESTESQSSDISESSETATTEYSTPEGETETETDTDTETKTATGTENGNDSGQGNGGQEIGGDSRSEAMSELYDALMPDATPQEYYAEMLGYADSINHTCTVVLNLCFATLLCAGIVAGSIIAHTFWSKFR